MDKNQNIRTVFFAFFFKAHSHVTLGCGSFFFFFFLSLIGATDALEFLLSSCHMISVS